MNNTEAIIKPSYDAKLTNQDLAPTQAYCQVLECAKELLFQFQLKTQSWN